MTFAVVRHGETPILINTDRIRALRLIPQEDNALVYADAEFVVDLIDGKRLATDLQRDLLTVRLATWDMHGSEAVADTFIRQSHISAVIHDELEGSSICVDGYTFRISEGDAEDLLELLGNDRHEELLVAFRAHLATKSPLDEFDLHVQRLLLNVLSLDCGQGAPLADTEIAEHHCCEVSDVPFIVDAALKSGFVKCRSVDGFNCFQIDWNHVKNARTQGAS